MTSRLGGLSSLAVWCCTALYCAAAAVVVLVNEIVRTYTHTHTHTHTHYRESSSSSSSSSSFARSSTPMQHAACSMQLHCSRSIHPSRECVFRSIPFYPSLSIMQHEPAVDPASQPASQPSQPALLACIPSCHVSKYYRSTRAVCTVQFIHSSSSCLFDHPRGTCTVATQLRRG